MASPQVENGYTKISNELLEAVIAIRLSGEESQVFWHLVRKTYGFGKKEDAISMGQFSKATGINRPCICRALNKLIAKNIVIKKDNRKANIYCIQKDYTKWKVLSKKITVIKKDNTLLSKKITKVLSKKIHTKDNKETITKERGADLFFEQFCSVFPGEIHKTRTLKNWNTLMKKKVNPQDLIRAAKNYRADCEGKNKTMFFYASNFLGRDAYYLDFLQDKPEPQSEADRVAARYKAQLEAEEAKCQT